MKHSRPSKELICSSSGDTSAVTVDTYLCIATSSDGMDCKRLESNSGGNVPMQIAMNNSVRATIVGCCFATEARLNE